jgi:hypothetical protein
MQGINTLHNLYTNVSSANHGAAKLRRRKQNPLKTSGFRMENSSSCHFGNAHPYLQVLETILSEID